jgi:kumamolisin
MEVTVYLRTRTPPPRAEDLIKLPLGQRHLSREAFALKHAADPEDVALVEEYAHEHSLTVIESSPARRSISLGGTAAAFTAAFGVGLAHYAHQGRTFRGRQGPVYLPQHLSGIVEGVFGLDDRPQADPHFRQRPGIQHYAAGGSFTPIQVSELYDFPAGVDGTGQCIAIIELGGGYRTADLRTYFQRMLPNKPMPKVTAVSVDRAQNNPTGDPQGADAEVMLDLEVAGSVAPGARMAVYFAPNTDRGFLDALTTAIHDPVRKPSVISISWGGPESNWTPQAMAAFDQACAAGAALGVTICAASGDNGSSDGVADNQVHVDFPASSPHVLACGGTALTGSGRAISKETVWNDLPGGGATGGGVSSVFAPPLWQANVNVPPLPSGTKGRGVPDVAGDADPNTGFQVRVDGLDTVIGGTSVVAPLWAGLVALIDQQLNMTVGFLDPLLYQNGGLQNVGALHDIVTGSNGAYSANPGWDACTGLGTPDGARLLMALQQATGGATARA